MENISIVIPAFDVADCIALTLERIRRAFGDDVEIIVVVNEYINSTARVVENVIKKDKNIKMLNFRKKLGKGAAILEGFKMAQGDIMGFVDADGPFDFSAIKENLTRLVSDKCDCIICSKWISRSFRQVNQIFFRKVLSRLFNLITRKYLNLNFIDTQAGAKFFTKELFNKIDRDFICLGYDFDVELLRKFFMKDGRIEEVYVPHYRNDTTTVHVFREILPIIYNLYRLKIRC